MEKIAPAHIDSEFSFRFPKPAKLPQQLLNFSKADIGYPGKIILKQVGFSLLGQSRIGLLGHNGAGKSTLIKALIGELPLVAGERIEATHLQIGYFAQHQLEALDLGASCALHLQRLSPTATEQSLRNFLGSFGFHGDRAFEEIRHFSGGEKARLALAIVAWQKPNLLVLDEPTNHLDLEVRHALTLALQDFDGAIVVVSHDRHLLRNTVDDFWLVDSGRVEPFDGDLQDYHRWLQDEKVLGTQQEASNSDDNGKKNDKVDRKEQRQAAAALREKLKPYTQTIKKCEQQIDALQGKLRDIEEKLADPALYEGTNDRLPALLKQQGALKAELEKVEEQWLLHSEKYEELKDQLC